MKALTALLILAVLPMFATAQSLDAYRWRARPIFIFTPAEDDPLFAEQYALLQEAADELNERRVEILLVTIDGDLENSGLFLDKGATEFYYDYFSAKRYQMELVLVGLDGNEKYRAENAVTPVSVLLEMIDAMPMRQREIRRGRGNKSQINSPTRDISPRRGSNGGG